jgi:DNA-binding winged helix-turn-helix (wHTH) protein/Tfp pilus assembly protein PilF
VSAVSSDSVVRFGVFEADLQSGELHKCGFRVKIQELPFHALKLLVSRPNEVVSREDLRHALWPDGVYVEFDRGVISAINRLRDSLGDSAENPIFIETVGRRGYRWIAPLHFLEPTPEGGGGEIGLESSSAKAQTKLWRFAGAAERLILQNSKYLLGLVIVALSFTAASLWVRRNASMPTSSPARVGSARAPANREAERFYLEGRYYWEKRTPESLSKAVDSFTQAIVYDPSYAPAYVGLADCYNLLREYSVMPAYEAYPRALAAAKKAVELDPRSSEAHASLAFASFFGMWDAATADQEFRRAIELNPNNAVAHHWYATYLASLRRYPESLAEIEHAQALDPGSKSVLADKGTLLFDAGRRQESIALLKQMEENEPDFISPHRYLKFIYLRTGDYSNYIEEARKEAALMHDRAALAIVEATEKGFAAGGGKALLEVLSTEQKRLFDRGQFSPFLLATTYSIMGNKQEALRYLKIAYDRRVDGVTQIESDHAFDNLSSEPAFQKLVAEVGLPPLR